MRLEKPLWVTGEDVDAFLMTVFDVVVESKHTFVVELLAVRCTMTCRKLFLPYTTLNGSNRRVRYRMKRNLDTS